jgi:hypothetical protein
MPPKLPTLMHDLPALAHKLGGLAIPIVIAITFYVFGFFVIANLLVLTGREIVIGLIAGTVGGVTTLVAVVFELGDREDKPLSELG